jgi:hypothetical protein
MNVYRILIVPAAVLATAAAVAMLAAYAGERSPTLDPGFVPNTGQINPGHAAEPWRDALPQDQQPAQEEARAALMMPDDEAVSAGGPGPLGATVETMPEKFSQRNELLDHVPTTAWPLPLNEQQRKQIYEAVMADNSSPPADVKTLKPGSFLTYGQTLDERLLPESVAGIDGLQGLKYVKGKDKVLLVRPPNGFVVDEITL